MIRGSCLCATVRWSLEGAHERMLHCHCRMCRKAHGTPFATYMLGSRAHGRRPLGLHGASSASRPRPFRAGPRSR